MSDADARKRDTTEVSGEEQYEQANPRLRRFIDLLVGVSDKPLKQAEAYEEAGYTGGSPASSAASLAHRNRAAINWRRDQLSEDSERQRLLSLRRLQGYAGASLRTVLGNDLVLTEERWRAIPDEVASLISEMTVETVTTKDGDSVRKVKLKLEPRMAAETQLSKLFGWPVPKKLGVEVIDVEAARERIEEAIRRRREAKDGEGV